MTNWPFYMNCVKPGGSVVTSFWKIRNSFPRFNSMEWDSSTSSSDHDDDNHQLWLTKRFAQARNLFTSMAYFRSCVIMHVKYNIINTKKAFKNVLIILSTLKYIINLSTLKYIIIYNIINTKSLKKMCCVDSVDKTVRSIPVLSMLQSIILYSLFSKQIAWNIKK